MEDLRLLSHEVTSDSHFGHVQSSLQKNRNFSEADREGAIHCRDWEIRLDLLFLPPALLGKLSFLISSTTLEDITSPKVIFGNTVAIFPMLFCPSSQRERDQRRQDNTVDPAIQWLNFTLSETSARMRWMNGNIFFNSSTTKLTQTVTGSSCSNWRTRGWIHSQTSQSPMREKHSPVRKLSQEPSTGSCPPPLSTKTGLSSGKTTSGKALAGSPQPPPGGH